MKTRKQVDDAREKIAARLKTIGLSEIQKTLLCGILNALVWVADGRDASTMDRLLSGEAMAPGQDHTQAMKTLDKIGKSE